MLRNDSAQELRRGTSAFGSSNLSDDQTPKQSHDGCESVQNDKREGQSDGKGCEAI